MDKVQAFFEKVVDTEQNGVIINEKCEDRKIVNLSRIYRELPVGERHRTPLDGIPFESSPLNGARF